MLHIFKRSLRMCFNEASRENFISKSEQASNKSPDLNAYLWFSFSSSRNLAELSSSCTCRCSSRRFSSRLFSSSRRSSLAFAVSFSWSDSEFDMPVGNEMMFCLTTRPTLVWVILCHTRFLNNDQ